MHPSKPLLSTALAGLVLAAALGCRSNGHPQGHTPTASAPQGLARRVSVPQLQVVYRESLGPADHADAWELSRGLYLGYPGRPVQFDLLATGGTTSVGTWNGKGSMMVNSAPLLEARERFERFAEAHGVARLYSLLTAEQVASADGHSLFRQGYIPLGRWYGFDRYLVVKAIPALTETQRAALPASGLEAMTEDTRSIAEVVHHPYADLPPTARETVDRFIDEVTGCFGFFIKASAPGSLARGGIIGKFMPGTSYGLGMFIERFWTSPEIRGQGYGRILMDNAVALAKARGVAVISLGTDQGLSYPFYEKYGFKRNLTLPGFQACEGGESYDTYEYILATPHFPEDLKLNP